MNTVAEARIEADPTVPAIHITREFLASPAQLLRAHTDPELYMRWVGPDFLESSTIDYWDARTGGSWRYVSVVEGKEHAFRGCFHEVSPTRLVQTFTYEGFPESVSLQTLTFTDLGDGRTRLHAVSLCESFEVRTMWLEESGMEVGVHQGYAKLDGMLRDGAI